jgi:hypothetical protein
MKANRATIKVGRANLHYSEHDHSAIEARVFVVKDAAGQRAHWPAGKLMKQVRALQSQALESFKDIGEEVLAIRANSDLNEAAIERMGKESINVMTDRLMVTMQAAAADMLILAKGVKAGFVSVTPRAADDVVGFLADQELRTMLRGMKPEERSELVNQAKRGDQPQIVDAILRANPLLSGVSREAAAGLERAGVAALYSQDLQDLRLMLDIFDDALATTSQAAIAVAGMVPNTTGYKGRFENWRSGCEGADLLRDFLSKMPAPPRSNAPAKPPAADQAGDQDPQSEAA